MAVDDRLIVGLGNPGANYEQTRHNAGFMALDSFARGHACSFSSEKWQGVYSRNRLFGAAVLLVKPQTFMNRSGECVVRFADFYRIPPSGILIVHDDLDLPLGKVKVVAQGGAGGHNGIRSIINHLGTREFARLKIGIGRPERNEQGMGIPVERYVLAAFSEDERRQFDDQLGLACEAVSLFIKQGVDRCMNRINGR